MTRLRATLIFILCFSAIPFVAHAQFAPVLEVDRLTTNSYVEVSMGDQTARGTNGVVIKYAGAILVADSVVANGSTMDVVADGNVRIQQGEQVWRGEHVVYNFKTRQMVTDSFRTGKAPFFAGGKGLHGDITNHVYNATNAFLTTDDISDPAFKVRARRIRIVPDQRIEAHDAVLYLGGVPVFYFPYLERNLGQRANNFNFVPGYRSSYGPFILGSYNWFLNDQLDGRIHIDYRERRGIGVGPDLNFHLRDWGEGTAKYYYLHDQRPGSNEMTGFNLPTMRQRAYFSYLATNLADLEVRSQIRYEGDSRVLHDFFPGEYRQDPQASTYLEVNKSWENFSLDVYTQPRLNNFMETVERLPDLRLTGFRQQVWGSPFYYESESSAGYYRRLFAETNSPTGPTTIPHFEAGRADTYHQVVLPRTFFGWLNVTPRVGGRFTYYTETHGPTNGFPEEESRTVFNTGAEVSFKASRLWPATRSRFFDLNGVRHIVQPSVNYVYVPTPNDRPQVLPQFDYELPSLRLLPIEYPEYNSIDSIDSQNALRFGLRNTLQTKRDGKVVDYFDWQMFMDWRVRLRGEPVGTNAVRNAQRTYSDLYSDLKWKPRSWLTLESQTRIDVNEHQSRMLLHMLTLEPNNVWSWTIGHFYLRDDASTSPTSLGQGNNLLINAFFYRLNENWGFRATHHYDFREHRMQEQYYTIYRDMRSWTAALSMGLRDNGTSANDFTIAFSFSLKAVPKFDVGKDTVRPYSLLGY